MYTSPEIYVSKLYVLLELLNMNDLKKIASEIRGRIIATSHNTRTPHLGSCLSCTDILVAAYFDTLKIDPTKPTDPNRDRFILSKGHGAAALFQVLGMRGFYSEAMLESYGEDGGLFAEHPPTPEHLPGIEAATGSLGHGLSIGLGMALAGRIKGQIYDVTVLLGDGECNEGSVWEAAMMAPIQKVGNLLAIIDFNKWQGTGRSEEVMELGPLVDKWRAFGWEACEIDGHDMGALRGVLGQPRTLIGKPQAVVAHTVKGKGISFMEDDNNWHYRIPDADELAAAYRELGLKL